MNALQDIDELVTAKCITHVQPTICERLYCGHMELVTALMKAQTQLHESNYAPAVRSALVGPAHTAVMRSARALAQHATAVKTNV